MIGAPVRNVKRRTLVIVAAGVLAAYGAAALIVLVVRYVTREPDVDLEQFLLAECGPRTADPADEAANLRVLVGNWSVDEGAMVERIERLAMSRGRAIIGAGDGDEWEKELAIGRLRADRDRTRPQWLTEVYRQIRARPLLLTVRADRTWTLVYDGKKRVGDWIHCSRGVLCATRAIDGEPVHGRDQLTFRLYILEADERPRHGTLSLDFPKAHITLRKKE